MKQQLISKSQRGITRLGFISIVVVVLAIAGASWFVYGPDKTQKVSNNDKAQQDAAKQPKCDYKDADLCKFFTGWKAQKHYTLTSTSEADGKKTTTVMKVESKDKYSMKVDGPTSYEMVVIGKTTYTKGSDGTWWTQTIPDADANKYKSSANVKIKEPSPAATADAQKVTYKKLGKERCGSLNCFKYQQSDPADTNTTTYLWFDDKDYQIRRNQTLHKDGSTYDSMFSYTKVSIAAPSPVKELAANQYIVPGQNEPLMLPNTGDMFTEEELQQMYGNQ